MAQPLSHLRNHQDRLTCACCHLPFATIQRNGVGLVLVVQSKHNGATHTNVLTAAQLRKLADEMEGRED